MFTLSVNTTPEGAICDSCLESPAAANLPSKRLPLTTGDFPDCAFCGDPITPDLTPLTLEDLDY